MISSSSNNRRDRGQGLVEYALILTLVAVVVILVLALMGPAVGNVYSEVVAVLDSGAGGGTAPTQVPTAVPTPIPTPQWVYCAQEHDYCSFSGTYPVRYGEHGVYNTLVLTDGTPCTNAVFGDPLYGTLKHCDVFK